MRIVLIGYMGSGKSTCGRQLAKKIKLNFIDLDSYITQKHNKSIPEIFKTEGEDAFRKLETTYLKEVLTIKNAVIAVGGGTPCFNDNMKLINQSSISIYMKASAELLAKRLLVSRTPRPLIVGKNEKELLESINSSMQKRETYYIQATHTIICEQKNINQSVNEMKNIIMNRKDTTL